MTWPVKRGPPSRSAGPDSATRPDGPAAHRDSPPRVVISEAIELARAYSGEDAAKFVNGVLDGAYRRLKEEGVVVE